MLNYEGQSNTVPRGDNFFALRRIVSIFEDIWYMGYPSVICEAGFSIPVGL
jgi:hypothetical protein